MNNKQKTMEKIVALCKNRGFVFAGSEIYGGLANSWDYGPLGVELKNNVKRAWWKKFVQENPYNVGLDAAILMNPEVWVASGHVNTFNDPLIDCKSCKNAPPRRQAHRGLGNNENNITDVNVEAMSNEEMWPTSGTSKFPAPAAASVISPTSASST
jgi:glycyl-tRNA synthetase